MGAYLSSPKTDKISTDELSDRLMVGASSMQGWRNSQEDAHNAIINFDTNTSFFAVYDGHGGAEVATYCADRLPEFLKRLDLYKSGKFEEALREAFLEFDRTLLEPEVVEVLKILAGERNMEDSDNVEFEEEEEDLVELHEESHIPLNELLEKYKGHPSMPSLSKIRSEAVGASGGGSKPQSPYLRGRRSAAIVAQATNKALMDPDSKPQGSSTSAVAAAMAACGNDVKPSSSAGGKTPANHIQPTEDTTVSSSSCSSSSGGGSDAHKTNENSEACNSTPNHEAEAANTNGAVAASSSPETALLSRPDSSHTRKDSGQNGSVTSSEAKAIISAAQAVCSKTETDESKVSGSNDDTDVAKQNGNVDSSTMADGKQMSPKKYDGSAISSTTSPVNKKSKDLATSTGACDDDEDDAEYQLEKSNECSSSEDLDDNDDDDDDDDDDDHDADNEEDENASEADSEEFDEDVDDEDDDEESILANQQFCANMIEEPGKDSGCTAVVALLHGRDLYVANAGDSRCVVCRNGKAIEMSLDHKPEDDEESARIMKAGGRVTLDGRVNGGLNLSRAIGDHAYKMNGELPLEDQMISARPDIKKLIITPDDEFMVLACDGIWNFMSSEEVIEFVRKRINKENVRVSQVCEELFDHCLAPDTMGDGTGCDNMTAVIVRFKPQILDLSTAINPAETEDALLKQKQKADAISTNMKDDVDDDVANQQKKAQKRTASPTKGVDDVNDINEAEQANKTKRLKTDIEEPNVKNQMDVDENDADADNDDSKKEPDNKTKILDSCSSVATSATQNSENVEKNEGDSVVSTAAPTANTAQPMPINPTVSKT